MQHLHPLGVNMAAGWRGFLLALLACMAATLGALPLAGMIDATNIAMIYLLVVALVAARLGSGPAGLSAFVSVAAFDFFFVPPRFSWSVESAQYLITFAVMLVVGLVIGGLTARLRAKAEEAVRREQDTQALYEMARELSGVLTTEQVVEVVGGFVAAHAGATARLHLPPLDRLSAEVRVVHESGAAIELSGATLLLPLKAPMRTRGVLQIDAGADLGTLAAGQRPLLEAVASLAAIAIERIHYVEVAQDATVKMESERLRAALLSAVSHDLRTPLTVLVGMADSLALAQPPLPEVHRAAASALRDQALRMAGLVDNLLQMARLQLGKATVRKEWQPLEEVVGASLQALAEPLNTRRVEVALEPDLPLLELDAVLIERVFCNLLENAAKYAPDGAIGISARRATSCVEISVCDRGPGIPAGDEEAVFNLFERGAQEGAGSGIGLGLAICRAIVEAHGGSIRAENREGGGACFAFSLPLGQPPKLEEEHGR
jgi:two-component system sensor histidine kinase KdpD